MFYNIIIYMYDIHTLYSRTLYIVFSNTGSQPAAGRTPAVTVTVSVQWTLDSHWHVEAPETMAQSYTLSATGETHEVFPWTRIKQHFDATELPDVPARARPWHRGSRL